MTIWQQAVSSDGILPYLNITTIAKHLLGRDGMWTGKDGSTMYYKTTNYVFVIAWLEKNYKAEIEKQLVKERLQGDNFTLRVEDLPEYHIPIGQEIKF